MLVNSNYKVGDVITIKMATAEEVVAKFSENHDDAISVTKPLVFTMNPQYGNAMLIPWLMSVDHRDPNPIRVNKSTIITVTKANKQIADHYTQVTSSIVAASAAETAAVSKLKV